MFLEEKEIKDLKSSTEALTNVIENMTNICNKRKLCFNWRFDDVCPFYGEDNNCRIDFVKDVLNTINITLADYENNI